jgi:hypothetical protein
MKIAGSLSALAAALVLSATLTGCGGMGPKPEELVYHDYKVYDSNNKEKLGAPKFELKNDALYLGNGETIMDEEGSIWNAMEFNGKVYYLVYNENNGHLKIKDQDGKLIKDFGESKRTDTYNFNGKMYIATTTAVDAKVYSNVYSNLWEFDGTKPKLIAKSVAVSGDMIDGLNVMHKVSDTERDVYGSRARDFKWAFYDIASGKRVKIKPSLVPEDGYSLFGKKRGYDYDYVCGFNGDTIVYIYKYRFNNKAGEEENREILEAQDLATGQSIILSDDNNAKFSFLTNGYDVVFAQGNRYVNLRTMKAVSIDSTFFQPIQLKDSYENLGGGVTWNKYTQYSMRDIANARGQGPLMFQKR